MTHRRAHTSLKGTSQKDRKVSAQMNRIEKMISAVEAEFALDRTALRHSNEMHNEKRKW